MATSRPDHHRSSARNPGLLLAAMTLANAMVLVDQTAVPLTLPAIMRHYDVGSQLVQWVLNGMALGTMGGIAAVAGAAGPVIGGVLTATLGCPPSS